MTCCARAGVCAPLASLAQLSFVTSLAVFDLAAHFLKSNADLSLKWPNDVLLKGRKLSGILAETIPVAGSPEVSVAIGCGVNLQHAPGDTRYGATSLVDHGTVIEPDEAWPVFIDAMRDWIGVWSEGKGFDDIRGVWTDRSTQIGTNTSLDLGGKVTSGLFEGLAADGALMLKTADGKIQLIRAGDVLQTAVSEP